MAKIPFTLEAWLKDKSQKVETKSGFPAKILHCDGYGESPMLVTVDLGDGCGMQTRLYFADGKLYKGKSDADLFIVTPEPELTEWQRTLSACLQKHGLLDCGAADRIAKESAAELLDLARKGIEEELKEKVLHDYWKQASDQCAQARKEAKAEALKEFEEKYKQSWFNEGKIAGRYEGLTEDEKYQQGVHDGKEEALEDLPRWEKTSNNGTYVDASNIFYHDGYYIGIKTLEKLPGFKEDEI